MRVCSARFFALDNAGSSNAASTAMMATTTMSSMSVKAGRERIFIRDLVRCFLRKLKHRSCQRSIPAEKRLVPTESLRGTSEDHAFCAEFTLDVLPELLRLGSWFSVADQACHRNPR